MHGMVFKIIALTTKREKQIKNFKTFIHKHQ